MPFGLGPRNCIGMRLAQVEIRMMIASILQQYTPVLCEKSVVNTVFFLQLAAYDANMLMIVIQAMLSLSCLKKLSTFLNARQQQICLHFPNYSPETLFNNVLSKTGSGCRSNDTDVQRNFHRITSFAIGFVVVVAVVVFTIVSCKHHFIHASHKHCVSSSIHA